ncbi:MAG: c-type cytochrome [bacterium]|nr:c-type cytochrome [bacterium]
MKSPRSPKTIAAVALIVAAAVAVAAWLVVAGRDQQATPVTDSPARVSPVTGADASNPDLVAWGSDVYSRHCASCHGADLQGEPNWTVRKVDGTLPAPPHDVSGHTWHHGDAQLFEMTKWGTAAVVGGGYPTNMPGFADKLDDDEIWAVLAFIKSWWPEDVQAVQARRSG